MPLRGQAIQLWRGHRRKRVIKVITGPSRSTGRKTRWPPAQRWDQEQEPVSKLRIACIRCVPCLNEGLNESRSARFARHHDAESRLQSAAEFSQQSMWREVSIVKPWFCSPQRDIVGQWRVWHSWTFLRTRFEIRTCYETILCYTEIVVSLPC